MNDAPVFLNALGIVCALGQGQQAVADALFASDAPHGVMQTDAFTLGRPLMLGAVPCALAELQDLPVPLRSRNNACLLYTSRCV